MDETIKDSELVHRTLSGDHEAFKTLVQRYQDMVYGIAYAYLRNFHDAQDLTQEVFIKTYQNLPAYDMKRPFGPWLYTIAKRTALDCVCSQRFNVNVESLDLVAEQIADTTPSPDVVAEKNETEQLLNRAIEHLSKKNRETLCLYYINGYSIKEISQFLSIPEGTVKRRLHISRKILREEVKMMKEAFDKNKLTWEFTQDVVNKVKSLKNNLADYLPEEFKKLATMSSDELKGRRNKLLRSVTDVLSVDVDKLELSKEVRIPVDKMTQEQRDYLWKTLHELELMEIISILQAGTSFTTLIQDFQSTLVEVGLYNAPDYQRIHNRPYVRFFGSQHSIQLGPIDE